MRKGLLAIVVVLGASACAPKTVPAPVVTTPKFTEFLQPAIPAAFSTTPAAAYEQRGWMFLHNGDLKSAEREFSDALRAVPGFYPAETSLGYVELARKDDKAALQHFDRAQALNQPADTATLVGRGEALLALNRDVDAVAAFESALAADPSLADLRRRVEVLKFRGVEQTIAQAREAARSGKLNVAAQAYAKAIASSPDSPFLYRELAAVERQQGMNDAALEHFGKAVALDSTDARSFGQIGELLEARGDFEGAAKAYSDALALEPNAEIERRLEGVHSKAAMARLPAEYRAIDQAPQITRADLAALIGIRLGTLLQPAQRSDAALITDVRGNWAATWIMQVARAGVMEPFPNHAFQPRTVVRRIDLAQAAARLLSRVAAQRPDRAKGWESARLKFSDLAPSHLAYPAASIAVAAGVMKTSGDNAFQPSRVVTGAEALETIGALEALAAIR